MELYKNKLYGCYEVKENRVDDLDLEHIRSVDDRDMAVLYLSLKPIMLYKKIKDHVKRFYTDQEKTVLEHIHEDETLFRSLIEAYERNLSGDNFTIAVKKAFDHVVEVDTARYKIKDFKVYNDLKSAYFKIVKMIDDKEMDVLTGRYQFDSGIFRTTPSIYELPDDPTLTLNQKLISKTLHYYKILYQGDLISVTEKIREESAR